MVSLGDTFQLADRGLKAHLFIVISDPAQDPDHIVTANFTSWGPDKDTKDESCVLDPGEHQFIVKQSCVNYRGVGRLIRRDECERALKTGALLAREPVSQLLLRRILDGAAKSPHIPMGNREILRRQGLLDGVNP